MNYPKIRDLQSAENFRLEVISAWIREEDGVREKGGKPSWEGLAKALEEIGQNGVGRTVRENVLVNARF